MQNLQNSIKTLKTRLLRLKSTRKQTFFTVLNMDVCKTYKFQRF